MKKLDLSLITGSTGMPLKKGTLLHIVESQREVIDGLIQGLTSYTTGNVVILYGCVITGTSPGSIANTAGAIYYNGEVYLVDAQTFSTTGANIPAWTIVETSVVSGTSYDTVKLTNAADVSIHKDRKFKLVNSPIGGSGISGYVADFNAAVVKLLNYPWEITGYTSVITGTPSAVVTVPNFLLKRTVDTILINMCIKVVYGAGAVGQVNDFFTITLPIKNRAIVGGNAPLGVATSVKTTSPFNSSANQVLQSTFSANDINFAANIGTIANGDVYKYYLNLQYPCNPL